MLQHISALTYTPWWLFQNGACPGVVVYKKPLTDKKLAESGIEKKKLEPSKNGLLVPDLIPVAYGLLDDWKLLIKGLLLSCSTLFLSMLVVNAHKSMLLNMVMRFRIALAQPTVVAEASTPG
ncbi:hypothetical protein K7X08_013209 [Anisodus acutangulus]|uniref:APO domain-containing protein n=1 Tax=Anisodus acutangulus TaxID=402998 RepID=A0A9Q1MFN3_9SOLA|nr:hypothetical protein K7X08_013209 [Anisodus acutangulus]